MSDGLYSVRLARVCPPRASVTFGSGAARAVACNNATTSVRLDNDIFQYPTPANTGARPGGVGRAIMRCHAEGGDIYINFDTVSTVVANSAATSGNTVSDRIPQNQEREYEIDPAIDLWMSPRTINGGAVTATLRYRITSFTTNPQGGSGGA